jgi:hypothetical protein
MHRPHHDDSQDALIKHERGGVLFGKAQPACGAGGTCGPRRCLPEMLLSPGRCWGKQSPVPAPGVRHLQNNGARVSVTSKTTDAGVCQVSQRPVWPQPSQSLLLLLLLLLLLHERRVCALSPDVICPGARDAVVGLLPVETITNR